MELSLVEFCLLFGDGCQGMYRFCTVSFTGDERRTGGGGTGARGDKQFLTHRL